MIMNFKILVIPVIILLLSSCGKSEQETKEDEQKTLDQKKEELETLNEKAALNLAIKYNAISGWDTLDLYSYEYQEMFIDSNRLISFKGYITDISKLDSNYLMRIYHSGYDFNKKFIAEITVDQNHFDRLESVLKSNHKRKNGYFIFKVARIISVNPEIQSDVDYDGDDAYSYLHFNFHRTHLFFKGKLLDFFLEESE
jgi:hypothetical protein